MDNRHALRVVNAQFADILGKAKEEDWELPTPCSEWTIRDLVRHVIAGHVMATSLLTGEEVVAAPGDTVEVWAARVEWAAEGEGALERMVRHPVFGELSGDAAVMIRWGDVCVHAWDLAQALGVDFTPEPGLAEAALEWLVPLGPGLGASGMFGEGADPGPGADAFARVLAITGRGARPAGRPIA
ncbi:MULTISPECIES: TIGR03086 family metal-binding protein [unclassified Streptomyces]|uniref:TIGR03086 family metal-binding protein n=1 Tax=unclassified Streptomyces TaxID=2593676 RepID=UPI00336AC22D